MADAWIGNLTRLAPYQPYFIAATLACLAYGYWLVRRARQTACLEGAACSRPLPSRAVNAGLVIAALLVAAALAFDFLAPNFLN
jgi:mercuric ion transport protein